MRKIEGTDKKILEFFDELDKLCRKYDLSIGHEDMHGSFILSEYHINNMNWLREAMVDNDN